MVLLTLRGTPTLYYGDELGMEQAMIPADRVRDPWERNVPGFGLGRDGARTPMQWDAGAFAGFSTVTPWLPLAPDAATMNVEVESADPNSLYRLYARLIRKRRHIMALQLGTLDAIAVRGDVLLFVRALGQSRILVALNLGAAPADLPIAGIRGRVVVACSAPREGETIEGRIGLAAADGLVIELAPDSRAAVG